MPQSLTHCALHLIFSTKNREPLLTADLKPRLLEYMGAVWSEHCGRPILINGPTDHVHALVSLSSTCSIADAVRILKSNASKWVHETFPAHARFAWQSGYAAFSVSESSVADVRRYVADQEERHKTVTFQDEYRAFLRRHGVAFDERYVWD
ncbi:MAG TPA: IS200/IS605 family transposase [Humisphaera sp.]